MADGDESVFADSAYAGRELAAHLRARGIEPMINAKGHRGRGLDEYQKKANRLLSSVRARGEHIFADITQGLAGFFCRYVGEARVTAATRMKFVLYNIRRLSQLGLSLLAEAI